MYWKTIVKLAVFILLAAAEAYCERKQIKPRR